MLTWKRSSRYSLASDCGRYSVAKVITDGRVRYESWTREPARMLGTHDDAVQAQARCQEHNDHNGRG